MTEIHNQISADFLARRGRFPMTARRDRAGSWVRRKASGAAGRSR